MPYVLAQSKQELKKNKKVRIMLKYSMNKKKTRGSNSIMDFQEFDASRPKVRARLDPKINSGIK